MHKSDFDVFSTLLAQLGTVYSKKLDDGLIQAYWSALKDQSLATVSEMAKVHMRYGKFFPKPVELRPKDSRDKPMEHTSTSKADERAMLRLEDGRRRDPQGWMQGMYGFDPNCRAYQLAKEHGPENIWYDIPARRWRHP
jgi:hypothetical protein